MRCLVFTLLLLGLAGCASRSDSTAPTPLLVTLKAERMPDAASYRSYFLKGGDGADLSSIRWQKLRPQIVDELAKKGLIEVEPSNSAGLCIYIETAAEIKLGTQIHTRPNIVFTPQSTSFGSSVIYTPKGPVFSQTSVTTPASTRIAGTSTYETPTVQSNGFVRIDAYAWKEWVENGAKSESLRQIWRVFAGFAGTPPATMDAMTETMLNWALRHAGDEHGSGKLYMESSEFVTVGLPD